MKMANCSLTRGPYYQGDENISFEAKVAEELKSAMARYKQFILAI